MARTRYECTLQLELHVNQPIVLIQSNKHPSVGREGATELGNTLDGLTRVGVSSRREGEKYSKGNGVETWDIIKPEMVENEWCGGEW